MSDILRRVEETRARYERENRESEELRQRLDRRDRMHQRIRTACVSVIVSAVLVALFLATKDAEAAAYEAMWAKERAAVADMARLEREHAEHLQQDRCLSNGCECASYTIVTYWRDDADVNWTAPTGTPINLGGGKVKYPITGPGFGVADFLSAPPTSESFVLKNCDFIVEAPEYVRIYICEPAGGGE